MTVDEHRMLTASWNPSFIKYLHFLSFNFFDQISVGVLPSINLIVSFAIFCYQSKYRELNIL